MKNTFRTSNKQFKQQVQAYILDSLSTDQTSDTQGQLANTVQAFNEWYIPYNQKQHPSKQEAFVHWLQCLPSELSVDYTNYNISNTLESWFKACDQPYKEKPNYTDFFYNTIYMNFTYLCKAHNINF